MTIDRLWAYSPEQGAWIKTEEVSMNEEGRLYQALGAQVIHLDQISDWTKINSLEQIGISKNAFRLKYHDESDYTYSGDYTYAAWSDIHSLDIVYPETIYSYNVHYYKDTINSTPIGVASFSCSISDWNPDWDIFIATSWKVDDNGDPINPTLYRDTPLTLTWEFFEMDRNLYKPTVGTYDDGLFLWNPRSWENKNVYFTFEELVTTGTQSVIYLPTMSHYKAAYWKGFTEIPVDMQNFSIQPKVNKDGHWDVEYKFQKGVRNVYAVRPNYRETQYKMIRINLIQLDIIILQTFLIKEMHQRSGLKEMI